MLASGRVVGAAYIAVTSLMIGSCAESIPEPSSSTVPVIQGVLFLGADRHSIWVEWSTPSDSEFTPATRPIASDLVQLSLISPGGQAIAFVPSLDSPGKYDVNLSLTPGATYSLTGFVAGHRIAAQTVVPAQLEVESPAQDTIVLSRSCGLFCEVPYRWHASGAELYEYSQSGSSGRFRRLTRDTVGTLFLFPSDSSSVLSLLAYDGNAGSFLSAPTPASSIEGAFGYLGSASLVNRVILWQ